MNFQTSNAEQCKILQSEIEAIKEKVAKLKDIDSEINIVSGLVKSEQEKNRSLKKNPRSLSKDNKKIRNSTANLKIKIYEQQKKLQLRRREHQQKFNVFLKKLLQQQTLVEKITELDREFRNEKIESEDLERLKNKMEQDLKVIEGRAEEMKKMVEQEKSIVRIYQEEKSNKVESIRRLKKLLNDDQTQADEDQSLILEQITDRERQMSGQNMEIRLVSSQRGVFHNQSSNSEAIYQNRKFNEMAFNRSARLITFNDQVQLTCSQNLRNATIDELETLFNKIEDNVVGLREKQQQAIENLGILKKYNKNIEASAKHTRTTKNLILNKVSNLVTRIDEFERQILGSIEFSEGLSYRLGRKEGERGSLRGKLGVTVEKNRLLGMVNQGIQLDYQKAVHVVESLKSLFCDGKNIVTNLLGKSHEFQDSVDYIEEQLLDTDSKNNFLNSNYQYKDV